MSSRPITFQDAVSSGSANMLQFLLKRGVNASSLDDEGHSLFFELGKLALSENFPSRIQYRDFYIVCTRMLKAHGTEISRADLDDIDGTVMSQLLELGAKPEAREFLLHWQDPNFKADHVEFPLHKAASNPCTVVLELLLKSGFFHLDASDVCGMTPLHVATRCNYFNNVKVLLEYGANPNLVTRWALETPYSIAYKKNNTRILLILLHYGAEHMVIHE
ncbi:hypothetical protein QAD02_013552 [Eretmocerus hayati]|uniref:Uncharacterized protein n=1 Tax=Eretmocerus hayati TaxID=131215 RepID=A0ACC2P2Z2_9HYME|nr:hypothetical protein QAD02_013552 [Eretmocerus hayati]